MPDTVTFHYNWVMPQISGSPTTWGQKINDDLVRLDTTLFDIDGRADSFVGEIKMFGGATAPPKWKLCDGTVYDVSDIPLLAPIIGNTYGGVSGLSCAVPNLQQKFAIGPQLGVLLVGATGGEATHILTAAEMPTHTHTPTVTLTDPRHAHTIEDPRGNRPPGYGSGPGGIDQPGGGMDTSDELTGITVTVVNANTGGGGSHNNLPPYVCINFIIKFTL